MPWVIKYVPQKTLDVIINLYPNHLYLRIKKSKEVQSTKFNLNNKNNNPDVKNDNRKKKNYIGGNIYK